MAVQGRLADTRSGTAQPAGSWRAYQVDNLAGIPATGVSAVAVSVTVIAPASAGNLQLAPNTSRPTPGGVSFLNFDGTEHDSNTAMVAVGTDGYIAVYSTVATDLTIDAEGYFTSGTSPQPGGFVPLATRIVDTRVAGSGPLHTTFADGSDTTIQVTGLGGIPASATSAMVSIDVISTSASAGFLTAYPTGATKPPANMNFNPNKTTSFGTTVDLNSSGQFSIYLGGGGPINVIIDVEGYFDGEPSASGFTPVQGRLLSSTALAPNSVTSMDVAEFFGIPSGPNLSGVALNVESSTSGSGYLLLWPTDGSEPSTSTLNLDSSGHQSTLSVVRPGATDGKVNIRNGSSVTVTVTVDAEGYFINPDALPPAIGTSPQGSGSRSGAQMITHPLTDRSGVQINPTNGNLLYTQSLLSLAGIGQSASVMVRYNALNDARPTLSTGMFEAQLYRNASGTITYTGPDGAGYDFVPVTGSGTGTLSPTYAGTDSANNPATLTRYAGNSSGTATSPVGVNATLVRVGTTTGPGTEYDLTFHPSQVMNVYHDNGSNITLDSSQDITRANKITYTYVGDALTTQTDTQGRTITYTYADPNDSTQPSTITDNSLGRTIHLTYGGPSGALSKIVDATGAQTLFSYTSGKLCSITDGLTNVTALGYDGSNRITSLHLAQGAGAGNGEATWTYGYPTSIKTTVTDPNSHTSNYAITGGTTTTITDPNSHATTSAWSNHNDLHTRTDALSDLATYDTSLTTYNLTKITSPQVGAGAAASEQFQYTSSASGGPGTYYNYKDYRPLWVKDAQGNQTTPTFNDWNEPTTIATPGTLGGTLHRTYVGDTGTCVTGKTGQLCTSTDGKGNVTTYAYDAAGNVHTITPPTPLGVQTFTYDGAGRVTAVLDGRGNTRHTCYDNNDRIVQVSYTSSNCAVASGVTYTFDADGNLATRHTASTGVTTTYTFDAQNRPIEKSDTPGTNTFATYDGAGNVLTYQDSSGTTTYRYDAANNLTALAEPGGSCPATPTFPNSTKCTTFTYSNANQRQVTRFPSNTEVIDAYTGGRLSDVTTKTNGGAGTVLSNRHYTYLKTGGDDQTLISQITDSTHTATDTNYVYDAMNRLTSTNPAPPATGTSYTYSYDANGNRTQQVAGSTTTDYGYNAADQLCWTATTTGTGCTTPTGGTTYTYDANGNQTAGTGTNTWTTFNQLASTTTGGSASYTYNGTTNAERATAGGLNYINGVLGQVSNSSGGSTNTTFIRDPSGTLIAMETSAGSYYYTTDNVGSVILMTNQAQAVVATYAYDPFGNTLSNTGTGGINTTNPYRYASGYTDTTTGLTKFGARYYNPTLGRFTQTDPSGQETNNYTYTGNNPISNHDPSGLCGEWYSLEDCSDAYEDDGTTAEVEQCLIWGGTAATSAAIGTGFGTNPISWFAVAVGAVGGCGAGALGEEVG